jgi:hypothetical protein
LKAGDNIAYNDEKDYTQVWKATRSESGTGWSAWSAWAVVAPKAALTGQQHPSLNRADPYETTYRQNYNNIIMGIQTTMPQTNQAIADTLNNMKPTGGTVSNNFGSVAIDGMLIQHLKFSTTGL